MNPHVSVIVPTYNREAFIKDCIDSLIAQTLKPHEIIIIDDGSTDNTESIVHRYKDENIIYIYLDHSGLPSVARNEGIRHASGDFIAFCDSDDMWSPLKLRTQLDLMLKNGWNASSTDAWIIGVENERYFEHYRRRFSNPALEILWNNYVITSSVVIRSEFLRDRQFNTSPALVGYEDYYLWLTVSSDAAIEYIDQPLTGYRRHSNSLSSNLQFRHVRILARILIAHPAYRRHIIIASFKILKLLKAIFV